MQLRFTTSGEDERSSDPLAAEMYKWMESGKTSVSWNFTTFPSQTFKDDFGAGRTVRVCKWKHEF